MDLATFTEEILVENFISCAVFAQENNIQQKLAHLPKYPKLRIFRPCNMQLNCKL